MCLPCISLESTFLQLPHPVCFPSFPFFCFPCPFWFNVLMIYPLSSLFYDHIPQRHPNQTPHIDSLFGQSVSMALPGQILSRSLLYRFCNVVRNKKVFPVLPKSTRCALAAAAIRRVDNLSGSPRFRGCGRPTLLDKGTRGTGSGGEGERGPERGWLVGSAGTSTQPQNAGIMPPPS